MPRKPLIILFIILGILLLDLVRDPEIRLAVRAVMTRQLITPAHPFSVSEACIQQVYDRHLSDHPDIPFSWFQDLARNSLIPMAEVIFLPGRYPAFTSPDACFSAFFTELIAAQTRHQVPLTPFLIALYETGTHQYKGLPGLKDDIRVYQVQLLGGALVRHYGLQDMLLSRVAPHYLAYYDLIRLFSAAVTTGLEDYPLYQKADAIFNHAPPATRRYYAQHYPEILPVYKAILTAHQTVAQLQNQLAGDVLSPQSVFHQHPEILAPFFTPETAAAAYSDIGLCDPVSNWQLSHFTQALRLSGQHTVAIPKNGLGMQFVTPTDPEKSQLVRSYFQALRQTDPASARLALTLDQIGNPRFLPYLIRQAKPNPETAKSLEGLRLHIQALARAHHQYRRLLYEAAYVEAALEQDMGFQINSVAALHKKLFDTRPVTPANSPVQTKNQAALQALYALYMRELSYTRMYMAPIAKDPDTDDGLSLVLIGPALDTLERFRSAQQLDTRALITCLSAGADNSHALPPAVQSAISTLDFKYGRVHQAVVMHYLDAR